jgi:hypothetical protein
MRERAAGRRLGSTERERPQADGQGAPKRSLKRMEPAVQIAETGRLNLQEADRSPVADVVSKLKHRPDNEYNKSNPRYERLLQVNLK